MTTKKRKKIAGRILLALFAALLLLVLITFITHRVKTNRELTLLQEKGYCNPVSVGDYSLNVVKFGNESGGHTIVALAGLGMGDCSVSMRQMSASLEENNLVVFVDRAGYGLSGDTNHEMTLEYIVDDYRRALKNAGIEAPYILMPHSIGGAYATYWCSQYPEEIEAVVFVDGTQLNVTVREEDMDEYQISWFDHVLAGLAKLGFGRYVLRDSFYHYPDNYSEDDQYLGDVLSLMTIDSIATLSECNLTPENIQKAFDTIVTNDVPKLYICASWGYETAEDFAEYIQWMNRQRQINNLGAPVENPDREAVNTLLQQSESMRQTILVPYIEKMGNCELVCLGGDHMIYEQKPIECGKIIKDFIDSLDG